MSTEIKIVMTPQELLRRMHAKNVKVAKKGGAYLKTAMQRSMRYTKKGKASKPGRPPNAHKKSPENPRGPLVRQLIAYEVQERGEVSVVAGPKKTTSVDPTIPQTLNVGGIAKKRQLKPPSFQIGKTGPLRRRGNRRFAGAMLRTDAQVHRAEQLVIEENQLRTNAAGTYIRPRPFTTPLLAKGGETFRNLEKTVPL